MRRSAPVVAAVIVIPVAAVAALPLMRYFQYDQESLLLDDEARRHVAGSFVKPDSSRPAPHVVTEVHDQPRDGDRPEADHQRELVVRRLMQEFRHGNFSRLRIEKRISVPVIFGRSQFGG